MIHFFYFKPTNFSSLKTFILVVTFRKGRGPSSQVWLGLVYHLVPEAPQNGEYQVDQTFFVTATHES